MLEYARDRGFRPLFPPVNVIGAGTILCDISGCESVPDTILE
ncbi:hypothetical protein [Methanofollis fontis]|nr:hypothetical protein [Methanofollis fontis]